MGKHSLKTSHSTQTMMFFQQPSIWDQQQPSYTRWHLEQMEYARRLEEMEQQRRLQLQWARQRERQRRARQSDHHLRVQQQALAQHKALARQKEAAWMHRSAAAKTIQRAFREHIEGCLAEDALQAVTRLQAQARGMAVRSQHAAKRNAALKCLRELREKLDILRLELGPDSNAFASAKNEAQVNKACLIFTESVLQLLLRTDSLPHSRMVRAQRKELIRHMNWLIDAETKAEHIVAKAAKRLENVDEEFLHDFTMV